MEEIDLKELFNVFWAKKVHVLLIVTIFIAIGYAYTFFIVKPEYQSKTSILLAKSNTSQNEASTITQTDVTLNQKLVSTYSELLKSETVLSQVINNLSLNDKVETLKRGITVSAKNDTEIIEIKVVDEEPKKAQKVAKEVAQVFIEKVAKEYYNMDNVYIVDEPKVATEPYNINHIKDLLIFVVIGFVISGIYVLLINMLDTTVKSKEDIERKLGLTVLTTIPMCDFNNGGKR